MDMPPKTERGDAVPASCLCVEERGLVENYKSPEHIGGPLTTTRDGSISGFWHNPQASNRVKHVSDTDTTLDHDPLLDQASSIYQVHLQPSSWDGTIPQR